MEELGRFRRRLQERLPVDVLVLFGSQATGSTHAWSDVDLLVVSPWFEGKSYIRRASFVMESWDPRLPVDFLCYTPKEFQRLREQVSIVSEALREGVEIPA